MRHVVWQATIRAVGQEAEAMRQDNRVILFSDCVPPDLGAYCLLHQDDEWFQPLAVDQQLELDGKNYVITAVGDVANHNLRELGHITLLFDGSATAELPGTVHVKGNIPDKLPGSGNIIISEPC
ncbi:PTS glucitol/sorbitol transporter subunit IIA [Musicola paradisiaca]|uniref:PTS system glucitol/sorbitol-specific IIA component n=1 Tax=Musicola paradisiaca (strain Ech703) TaxID=579405 RepID=C6C744_MUSP7|nr:PTS glucitol/sorbitol transporter subunit IIA [Musicola paradisiaca]ACS85938.1 PTS system glucitol/sorbitol-specific IIA component [Musicola paradisiaca Ech703]